LPDSTSEYFTKPVKMAPSAQFWIKKAIFRSFLSEEIVSSLILLGK